MSTLQGFLAPAQAAKEVDNIDADSEEAIEEVSSEEDQDAHGTVVVPGTFSPALNPKELPRSIGMSFITKSDLLPENPEYVVPGRVISKHNKVGNGNLGFI